MRDLIFPDLQALARALQEHPCHAESTSAPLLAYGYVRTSTPEPTYAHACGDLLHQWASDTGWELGAVFRDVDVDSSQLIRPALAGLLDALSLPHATLAIVVDSRQLSRKPEILRRFTSAIRRTGSHIRTLEDEVRK